MIYLITEQQYNEVNAELPNRLEFGFTDGTDYYLDGDSLSYFDVDLDVILDTLYGQTLTQFLSGLDTRKDYILYNYRNYWDGETYWWPEEVDFKTELNTRLHPQNIFEFGELVKTVYHANVTVNPDGSRTYDTPVVQEVFNYTRDPSTLFPISRQQEIQWYFTDGTLDDRKKIMIKVYDELAAMQELQRRRDNNINLILSSLIPLVMSTDPTNYPDPALVIVDGQTFFADSAMAQARDLYIKEGNQDLINLVATDNRMSWMDNDISALPINTNGMPTIRDHILYELTYGSHTP